jgi:hypothetical protein
MNTKGLEPYDVELLEGFLERAAREATQGNFVVAEELLPLLRCSLGRIAANRVRGEHLPVDLAIPDWGKEQHIADWIVVSMLESAEWLSNVDGRGRPKKLTKCGSYDDLVREADRYSEKKRAQMAKVLGPDDETFEASLGGGYTLVRLLTPAALDLESARMHHCLGDGAYDQRLAVGWGRYLSVRDGRNRPVATIEVQRETNARWSIRQIAGKRNELPPREVMDLLKLHARKYGWHGRDFYWPSVTASDGREYDVDSIPPGTTVHGDLDVSDSVVAILGKFTLPTDLTVTRDMSLSPEIAIPERLTVYGHLSIRPRPSDCPPVILPDSLHVDREIRLWHADDVADSIPVHLRHRIQVTLRKLSGFAFTPLFDDVQGQDNQDNNEKPARCM